MTRSLKETMHLYAEGLLSGNECLGGVLASPATNRERVDAIRVLARRAGAGFRVRHYDALVRADPWLYGYLTRYWITKDIEGTRP